MLFLLYFGYLSMYICYALYLYGYYVLYCWWSIKEKSITDIAGFIAEASENVDQRKRKNGEFYTASDDEDSLEEQQESIQGGGERHYAERFG